jgi:hypothetical protein
MIFYQERRLWDIIWHVQNWSTVTACLWSVKNISFQCKLISVWVNFLILFIICMLLNWGVFVQLAICTDHVYTCSTVTCHYMPVLILYTVHINLWIILYFIRDRNLELSSWSLVGACFSCSRFSLLDPHELLTMCHIFTLIFYYVFCLHILNCSSFLFILAYVSLPVLKLQCLLQLMSHEIRKRYTHNCLENNFYVISHIIILI